jgi:hypothetical protein
VIVADNKSINVSSTFCCRVVGFVIDVLFERVLSTDALLKA